LAALAAIGEAESRLHGVPLAELHLHEIGAIDTIIDVVGGMAALELLGVERVYADPVHTGTGHIATAHGVVPNPTPATRAIFGDFPLVPTPAGKELATPTGAAMLVTLVRMTDTWGATPPAHRTLAAGFGAGGWDLPDRPNVLTLVLGEAVDADAVERRWDTGRVSVLTTNIDDLSPERYPALVAALVERGALDVALFPCTMKGGRPGVQLEAQCDPAHTDDLAECLFREGATLGIRVQTVGRFCLPRRTEVVTLSSGDQIGIKVGLMGDQPVWRKPEFRDLAAAAERTGRPLPQVLDEVTAAHLPPWAFQS
ncbi:MAG TPA: LarC family nickel insertion protein, partial [bacterium]|nr:LarC family nickel insertion protein [bacterium]